MVLLYLSKESEKEIRQARRRERQGEFTFRLCERNERILRKIFVTRPTPELVAELRNARDVIVIFCGRTTAADCLTRCVALTDSSVRLMLRTSPAFPRLWILETVFLERHARFVWFGYLHLDRRAVHVARDATAIAWN